jgi:outer membrane protein with beta-barrel domain
MKKVVLLAISMILFFSAYTQDKETKDEDKKFSMGVDLFSDIWMDTPDGLDASTINRGIDIFGFYNYRFGKSVFSFALGAGLSSHNLYSNSTVFSDTDTSYFVQIPDSISYKRSKLNLTYFDIPLEFRVKTKGKFRLAAGFKVGFLISQHTKYKGDNMETGIETITIKSDYIKHLESFRYGPTLRIGYKWANLFAYYQLSDVFSPDKGPEMKPLTVGISLMPF